ncbi:MAG TPA: TIGR03619 family F420-dependent LLM class oxidoreductase [Actinomycetes bacterium]|nr:TIGR03619 family F420-dependent LLM class oxidoreductase [Actinomycetes bacterium]
MRIGFGVPISGAWATPGNQVRLVRRAEELGYHSVWTFQRLLVPEPPDERAAAPAYRSVLDAIIPLAFLAGQSDRIRLGLSVVNVPFFAPAVLAKQLTTLDILSGGRLDVALGIGWSRQEYAAAGAPYRRRGARAEEFVAALRALWTEEVVEFHGEFYEIPRSRVEPKPVQRPHPPLLLGGGADAALRRAGRIADGWTSSSGADLKTIGGSIEVVRQAAREAGRDPGALRFVCRGPLRVRPADDPARRPLTGSFDEIRRDLDDLREQGVTEVFLDMNYDPEIVAPGADPAEALRRAETALGALAPGVAPSR